MMKVLCLVWLVMMVCVERMVSSPVGQADALETQNQDTKEKQDKLLQMMFRQAQDQAALMEQIVMIRAEVKTLTSDIKTVQKTQEKHGNDTNTLIRGQKNTQQVLNDSLSDMDILLEPLEEQHRDIAIDVKKLIPFTCSGYMYGVYKLYLEDQPVMVPCDGEGRVIMMRRMNSGTRDGTTTRMDLGTLRNPSGWATKLSTVSPPKRQCSEWSYR